jgi:hypothetical protein
VILLYPLHGAVQLAIGSLAFSEASSVLAIGFMHNALHDTLPLILCIV